MSEIVNASAVRFDSLSATGDGYTLLSINGKVCKSDKLLSEMVQSAVDSEHFATEQWVNEQGFIKEETDWTETIKEASANAVDSAIDWVEDQGYLTEHQSISADEWNSCYETVSANSATWMTETDWTDDINAASAYALDEAKTWVENQNYITGVDLSNYYQKTETSGASAISGALDLKEDKLTFAGENNTITAINSSAIGGGESTTYNNGYLIDIDSNNNINIRNNNCIANTANYAYALGNSNSATGSESLAVGFGNKVTQNWAVAIGKDNNAFGTYGVALGNNTSAGNYSLTFGQQNSAVENSIAGGLKNSARTYAIAFGSNNMVTGDQAGVAIGFANSSYNAFAYGKLNNVNGPSDGFAVAFGIENSATKDLSFAFGKSNFAGRAQTYMIGERCSADGKNSIAIGYKCYAHGENAFACGNTCTANSNYSFAIGYSTKANGIYAFAEGNVTTAQGLCSHAEGYKTLVTGEYSHAEGYTTSADGNRAHAEGYSTKANGYCSHAEGQETSAIAVATHSEGYLTLAQGIQSHAEGLSTNASGSCSHAEGARTSAIETCTHAEGADTIAVGAYSHAEGIGTIANTSAMHVGGKYNKTSADAAFVIGNGAEENNVVTRSDAFIVDWNGNVSATGDMYTSAGQVVTDVMLTSATNNSASFVTNGIADLTPLYTYIKSLEDRIAALEAAQGGFTVNGIQPTVNGNTITVGE